MLANETVHFPCGFLEHCLFLSVQFSGGWLDGDFCIMSQRTARSHYEVLGMSQVPTCLNVAHFQNPFPPLHRFPDNKKRAQTCNIGEQMFQE